jgi:cation diffusion facilitator family transporter
VAIAAIGNLIWPELQYLDPIAAVVVTIFILQAAWGIVWPALQKLADAGAGRADRQAILALAESVPGVRGVHGLRTRSLGTGWQVDLHVLVDPDSSVRDGHDIAHRVEALLLSEGPTVASVLLHVEPDD